MAGVYTIEKEATKVTLLRKINFQKFIIYAKFTICLFTLRSTKDVLCCAIEH